MHLGIVSNEWERNMFSVSRFLVSASETADILRFSCVDIFKAYKEKSIKGKIYLVSSSSLSEKAKSVSERRMNRLQQIPAEDHTGCLVCQLRTGKYSSHRLTTIGEQKIEKTFPGLMSLDYCYNIWMAGSKFCAYTMKR